MTTERFRNYVEKETLGMKEMPGVRDVQESEATTTAGLGSRPAGDDFEDAPLTANPYAEGDLISRLGDEASEAHEEAEDRHANQETGKPPLLQGRGKGNPDLRRRFGNGDSEYGSDPDLTAQ